MLPHWGTLLKQCKELLSTVGSTPRVDGFATAEELDVGSGTPAASSGLPVENAAMELARLRASIAAAASNSGGVVGEYDWGRRGFDTSPGCVPDRSAGSSSGICAAVTEFVADAASRPVLTRRSSYVAGSRGTSRRLVARVCKRLRLDGSPAYAVGRVSRRRSRCATAFRCRTATSTAARDGSHRSAGGSTDPRLHDARSFGR